MFLLFDRSVMWFKRYPGGSLLGAGSQDALGPEIRMPCIKATSNSSRRSHGTRHLVLLYCSFTAIII